MFGEGESESPRVPSPWDSLMSSPTGSPRRRSPSPLVPTSVLPKLVPENEEGNIEYKLQLLDPTPARFARLVTQLKWRLLEGGGQAYYELGVADSGELIGLERNELERTLETLEMMAGEIGASVIVVKEVEIPLNVLDQASRRISPSESATEVDSSTTEVEEEETEEEEASDLELDPLERTASDTIFSMDNDAEDHAPNYLAVPRSEMPVPIDLEIAVVYKPRPFRKRDSDDFVLGRRDRRHGKGKGKGKRKKSQPPSSTESSSALSTSTIEQLNASSGKPHNRRLARDRRREERRLALLSSNQVVDEPVGPANTEVVSQAVIDEVTHSLEGLHVPTSPVLPSPVSIDIIAAEDDEDEENVSSSPLVAPRVFDMAMKAKDKPGVRLIVEALVVRKLSIEEGFLDFEGFQIS